MPSPLENLATTGEELRREAPDAEEYRGLLNSARKRLADSRKTVNSLESRFDLTYSASHALCHAALRRQGFRARQRHLVFKALPHTLGLGPEVWRVLARCHDIRNEGEYEGELNVDEDLVADLIATTTRVLEPLDALGPIS